MVNNMAVGMLIMQSNQSIDIHGIDSVRMAYFDSAPVAVIHIIIAEHMEDSPVLMCVLFTADGDHNVRQRWQWRLNLVLLHPCNNVIHAEILLI